ncbi:hypothetical protein Tsubulata_008091 [Turnera subulata]|uniref:EngB-type G domain-containing protein n=1 Tax=Turnera subulata TaxID=218843 RepID=A0A9Q0FCE2_9ROSI|nr:hypothetical protein Tsubulata_008091 [Turnera subulata]
MSAAEGLRHRLNKKLKFSGGNTKTSKGGSKRGHSNIETGKAYKEENAAWRQLKSREKRKNTGYAGQEGIDSEFYGKRKFEPGSSDRKRKRIYAQPYVDEDQSYSRKAPNSKALYEKRENKVKDNFAKGKSTANPLRSMRVSRRLKTATSETKNISRRIKDTEDSAQVSSSKRKTGLWKAYKQDGDEYGPLKKHAKSKSDSKKLLNQDPRRFADESPTFVKRSVQNRKSLVGDDSEVLDDQPKKRKYEIRLDPHDISNKRLDDEVTMAEHTKDKKKEVKDVEMSKNAQFRAIKPSPSILSYVEDNLLGRRRLIELKRAGYNIELSAPLDNIPFSSSTERERIEENIFRNKMEFFAAAKVSSSFPAPDLPEIAFAGRSNVGKSSMLNALTRQWGVARTSDKPGLTQTINFFKLGSKLCLVDLPGYGFAYAKEEVKDSWEELVKEYVSTRVGLKRVCLLVDTKWGMKPRDHELINLMERSQTKYQIVLTKTDVVFPIDVARRAMQIEESLKASKSLVQPVDVYSFFSKYSRVGFAEPKVHDRFKVQFCWVG